MSEANLLRDALIFFAAAVICVPLAARVGVGSVLGYLIAGALIGPWGLALVTTVDSILRFAELGVVLMLFLIGLELEPKRLLAMRYAVFAGGALQMSVCTLALTLGGLSLGLPWLAALVAGFALALSSTAILAQSLAERSLVNATIGRSAIGLSLFQDIVSIPFIAVVPLLAAGSLRAGNGAAAWSTALQVLGVVAAIVFGGRLLVRPVLRLVAKSGVREIFTACALLLVLGVAELMMLAGASMALGAFIAGVLLASSEYKHALESDIQPFRGLLLGLFFIAVDMSIDFGLLASVPLKIVAVVLGFYLIKTLLIRLMAGPLDVPKQQRWLFALLLATGSEFAFVVFGVAREARILPGDWDATLTLAAALSMALTPLALLLRDGFAGRQAVTREPDTIDDSSPPVIIAGFGRYGQIIGRMLAAAGIPATVLDRDPENIDFLRRFGFKVFYGDATRLDLLEAAGAARARLLVVALDEVDTSLRLVDLARARFPQLKLVVRARNVRHALELAERGVSAIQRETFESALVSARQALELLGADAAEAREIAERFRRQNEATLLAMQPHFRDEAKLVALAKSGREELEENLRRDREARAARVTGVD